LNKAAYTAEAPLATQVLWAQRATDQNGHDDEAEPLEDDVYPGNDEYEDVPEEDEA